LIDDKFTLIPEFICDLIQDLAVVFVIGASEAETQVPDVFGRSV